MLLRLSNFRQCFAILALLLSIGLLGGCSRFTRTRQCRALIARINPSLDEVTALSHGATTSASYIASAGRYERLAAELGPMEFSSEEMAKDVAEYASILKSVAQTLRALAIASDSNDLASVDRLSHEIERLSVRERASVSKMNTWCQPNG